MRDRTAAFFSTLLVLASLTALPSQAEAGTVLAGSGNAVVEQSSDAAHPEGIVREVRVVGGIARGALEDSNLTAVRLQFIRPDEEAVGFLVWAVPLDSGYSGNYVAGQPGVELQCYEQAPNDPQIKRFLLDEWEGEFSSGRPSFNGNVHVSFDVTVVDYGADEVGGTDDDRLRRIQATDIIFYTKGDLSEVQYHQSGATVVNTVDTVIIFDDGCSGSNEYYDDGSGYNSGYDDSYDSYDDTSCDGDVYDDSNSDTSDSDYDDSSCDGDWDDDSDDDWGSDDWLNSPEDVGVAGGTGSTEKRINSMSPWPSLVHLAKRCRRPLRMAPLLLSILFILMVRRRSSRREEEMTT